MKSNNDLMSDRTEMMSEQLQTEPETPDPFDRHFDDRPNATDGFAVGDLSTANWVVRKVTSARQYAARVEAWAAAEIHRARREEEFFLTHYGGQLESWLRGHLIDEGSRKRSINLPAGFLGLRAEPARLTMTDEAALLNWCRAHLIESLHIRVDAAGADVFEIEQFLKKNCPDSRQTITISKPVVGTYFASTGDLPDGAQVIPRQDVLVVR